MKVIGPQSRDPLRRAPVAVIDWETTWLDDAARTQHPVSVAIVHCELGVAGSERVVFHSLIKPSVSIRPEATAIHGVSDAMVKDAPTAEDLADQFEKHLDGRVVGAYNIPFDIPIMARYVDLPFGTLDPLVWARVVDRKAGKKTLTAVAARRGITFAAHEAVADALTTAKLMPMLLAELRNDRYFDVEALDSIAGIWAYTKKEALSWERFLCSKMVDGGKIPDAPWARLVASEAV